MMIGSKKGLTSIRDWRYIARINILPHLWYNYKFRPQGILGIFSSQTIYGTGK